MRIELTAPFSFKDLLKFLNMPLKNDSNNDITISAISTDSRIIKSGDLFFPLKGENYDGEDYVSDAISRKATVFSSKHTKGTVCVNNVSQALLDTASFYLSKLAKLQKTVAITGSVGKSTTKEFTNKILSSKFRTHATYGNYNNHIGVPHTALSAPRDTEILITELGMNHLGEISSLSKCIHPDIAAITNIGTSHIGNLQNRENIALAKSEIADGMSQGHILVPYDEPLLNKIKNRITFGYNTHKADFNLIKSLSADNSYSLLSELGNINDIIINTGAEHILVNMLIAIALAKLIGMEDEDIKYAVSQINCKNLCQRFIKLKNYTIFDDSYNASKESIEADLKFLKSNGYHPIGAFIGDVLELGDMEKEIHRQIGELISKYKIDSLYLYGSCSSFIAEGALSSGFSPSRIFINTDVCDAENSIKQIEENHLPNETILFKASHKLRFDKIADTILEKERCKNDRQ